MATDYIRRFLLLAVMVLLAACGSAHYAASTPTTSTTDHTSAEAGSQEALSQNVLDQAIEAGAPGCSAAVGVEGKVVWTGVRGVSDMSTGNAITTHTVFDIASVSKQFTATALLLLVDAGKLTLDDPLSRYVPELPAWATTVTVGQLMHQRSGIPDYVPLLTAQGVQFTDRITVDQELRALVGVPKLEFQPGSQFEYSNSNYLLLGEIVHRVSREPLPQFLSEQIFDPLGLTMVMDPTGPIPDEAVSYVNFGEGYVASKSSWQIVGDGGIHTTPSQLVYWADNYRTGRVGGSQLLEAQLTGAEGYGGGIYVLPNGMLHHPGSWAGSVTTFRVSKDRRTSLALSCNTNKQYAEALGDSLGKLWM